MNRWIFYLGLIALLVIGVAGMYWWLIMAPNPASPPSPVENSDREIHPEHQKTPDHPKQDLPKEEATRDNTIFISPDRLQTIGVRFEEAAPRSLERSIRTVGRVEIDERQLARVNIKFEGWIEKVLVSAIGDHVKKHEILFTIYSPDLFAAQEESLLALQSLRELGQSEFPEVARGAKDLLESTRRRFQLWDIPENHLEDLKRTGEVMRTHSFPHYRNRS